jgi:hypothetical protein
MNYKDSDKRYEKMNRECDGAYGCGKFPPEVLSFLHQELDRAREEERKKVLSEIDPFDLVEPCVPDCTPVQHAYHQGTWDSQLRLEKILDKLNK